VIHAAADLSTRDAYFALVDTLVPWPIVWVATCSATGVTNLAPFSFFTGVTATLPTVAFSIGPRTVRGPDGARS
jgi:flavin reductase (DIM6/NTAB) family NADH-FMN oxidoreductase RutF